MILRGSELKPGMCVKRERIRGRRLRAIERLRKSFGTSRYLVVAPFVHQFAEEEEGNSILALYYVCGGVASNPFEIISPNTLYKVVL